jgi:catechol 2,3-dioxygenase-like lactoylglutathione lyase family enzyme
MPIELNHTIVPARDPQASAQFESHHYAFQVSEGEFEAIFARIQEGGITYYADPACREPGQVYHSPDGRRGTYFRDPDDHLMEILTPPAA